MWIIGLALFMLGLAIAAIAFFGKTNSLKEREIKDEFSNQHKKQ